METKICRKCGEEKILSEFYKDKTKLGVRSICILCYKKRNKKYHDEHKEAIKKTKKKYRDEHKEEIKIKNKNYSASLSGTITNLLKDSKRRAKCKNRTFTLTTEWIREKVTPLKCEVSEISLRTDGPPRDLFRPSIDRIDCSKGYTPENCRIVSTGYNLCRNDSPDSEVKKIMARYTIADLQKDHDEKFKLLICKEILGYDVIKKT